jgi:hypothetical protein
MRAPTPPSAAAAALLQLACVALAAKPASGDLAVVLATVAPREEDPHAPSDSAMRIAGTPAASERVDLRRVRALAEHGTREA